MNILIAADSFKDALSALAVCQAIEAGIRSAKPEAKIRLSPLADGGEGTYEVLANSLRLQPIEIPALDPLFRPIMATYGGSIGGEIAFVEMAKTAGLQLLLPEERNPLVTTSFGVGMQMADAIRRGTRHIILAIGGSATNDAGIGMAAALGWKFLDKNGEILSPTGGNLIHINAIVPPSDLPEVSVEIICDVTNPLFGPMGAAHVYARQKGADDAAIAQLDYGLQHFAQVVKQSGYFSDPNYPGAGAAGGMGFGAMCFLQAELRRGIEVVLGLLDFEEQLDWADIVVTGEGKIDAQTAQGKLVQGLCQRAKERAKPVIALCGRLEASEAEIREIGLEAAYCINDPAEAASLATMLQNTGANLEITARRVFKSLPE